MIDYMTSNKHEFRVGSRVRIINCEQRSGFGTILELQESHVRILWDEGMGSTGTGISMNVNAIEFWPPIITIQQRLKRLVEA